MMDTRRAIRSPQRSTGAEPAAIAASIDLWLLRDRDDDGAEPGERVDPLGRHAAADDDARARRPRRAALGDAERGLAERGLRVDAALAGDDEVGAGELAVEVGRVHDELDAGHEVERPEAIAEGEQREADAARGAGARRLALVAAGRSRPAPRPSRPAADRARRPGRGVAPFWGP